jgi:SAM-dependent methyltransferase
MTDHRKKLVADGYDAIVVRYLAWSSQIEVDPREPMLGEFLARTETGAHVLDLGCGAGVPSTKALANRFDVTGVDSSRAQIARARRNVPAARFLHGDMGEIEFAAGSFEGVTALYSISHLPREEHGLLFDRIARWLKPDGLFLASLGATDSPDWIGDWLGRPMFFSSFPADTNRALLMAAGFELLIDEVLETVEPEGPVPFHWVLARNHRRPG